MTCGTACWPRHRRRARRCCSGVVAGKCGSSACCRTRTRLEALGHFNDVIQCLPHSRAGSRRFRRDGVRAGSNVSGDQVRRTCGGRRRCGTAAKPSTPADSAPAPQAARRGAAFRRRRASASPASRSTTRSCWSGGRCWSCPSARSSVWSRRRAAAPPPSPLWPAETQARAGTEAPGARAAGRVRRRGRRAAAARGRRGGR